MKYTKRQLITAVFITGTVLVSMSIAGNEDKKDTEKLVKPRYTSKVFQNMTTNIPAETARMIVEHSKRPKTLAAIASVETGKKGKVTTRGKAGEVGIFQVMEKDWGYAGRTTMQQIMKADHILDELVKECGDEHAAIKAYNGAGAKAEVYRRKVYAELRRINKRG